MKARSFLKKIFFCTRSFGNKESSVLVEIKKEEIEVILKALYRYGKDCIETKRYFEKRGFFKEGVKSCEYYANLTADLFLKIHREAQKNRL